MEPNKTERIEALATQIWGLARDSIMLHMRFLDLAMVRLGLKSTPHIGSVSCDGNKIYYDSVYLLQRYKKEQAYAPRLYLHILLHEIFLHRYKTEKLNQEYWDLACDIAVEAIIIECDIEGTGLEKDVNIKEKIRVLRKQNVALTAEKIYKYFCINPLSEDGLSEWQSLFYMDEHLKALENNISELSEAEWKKITERVKAELKTFSKDKNNSESLEENLNEATKNKVTYEELLKKFSILREDIVLNDDEFDYIYYSYGMDYIGMPLIEPLEYKEVKKIREFAVVLDTSSSCSGALVRSFVQKTYEILTTKQSFFQDTNIHIIMCDNEVQSDTKITCREDFDQFLKNGKLLGFGATDFRPAFNYIDDLIKNHEFENFKGLIYFTDGYGIYPEWMPAYNTMFVFLTDSDEGPRVPAWAIKVVLNKDELDDDIQGE